MAATEEKDVEKTISEDLVVTKYKLAGEIVNSKYINIIVNAGETNAFRNITREKKHEIPIAWTAEES